MEDINIFIETQLMEDNIHYNHEFILETQGLLSRKIRGL
jgi:hypothetical protein